MPRSKRLVLIVTVASLVAGISYTITFGRIRHQSAAPRMRAQYYANSTVDLGSGYALVPDYDWTLKSGKACYGIQGYLSATQRSFTRIVCGRSTFLIPLPLFFVTGMGVICIFALGTLCRLFGHRKETRDAVAT